MTLPSTLTHTHDTTGLETLDPSTTPARDAAHFRAIIAASQRVHDAEAELEKLALEAPGVIRTLDGRGVRKVIVRAPKLVSIVPE